MDANTLERARQAVRAMSDDELTQHHRVSRNLVAEEAWTALVEELTRRGLIRNPGLEVGTPEHRQRATDGGPAIGQGDTALPHCPKCGSTDVRSFRVLFESGTMALQSSTTIGGFNQGGGIGFAVAGSTGLQQSALAAGTAPPARPGQGSSSVAGFALLFGLPSLWYLYYFFTSDDRDEAALWLFVLSAGLVVLAVAAIGSAIVRFQRETRSFAERLSQWQRSWRCMRCGAAFQARLGG